MQDIINTIGSAGSEPHKIVGYFENWAQYRPEGNGRFLPANIVPSLLTHINFAFAIFGFYTWSVKPDKQGDVIPGEARYTGDYTIQPVEWNDQSLLYPEIQKLKVNNPNLKTLISIGGWSFNSGDDKPNEGNPHPFGAYTYKLFSQMASSPSGKQQFISSAIHYCHNYGFDGIDIDWEYPGDQQRGGTPADFQNFLSLLEEFRRGINKPENWSNGSKLLLTIAARAIPPSGEGVPDHYLERCASHLDWLNLMTYDFHGAWEAITGVNAPLLNDSTSGGSFSISASVTSYVNANVPREKIVLGMPTYGRTFIVAGQITTADDGFGKPATGNGGPPGPSTRTPGFLSYYEILKRQSSSNSTLTQNWDDITSTPYAYNSTTREWVTYDNPTSIAYKVQYMVGQGLAGAMIWALGQDDFQNGFPLLQTINRTLQEAVQARVLASIGKRYDEVTFLTTHNAYANRHDGWMYFQQDETVAEQLANGVRALMLDVDISNGEVIMNHKINPYIDKTILLHGKAKTLSEILRTIRNFLDVHTSEMVTIIFESYVRDAVKMKKAFDDAGVWEYLFVPDAQGTWPTIDWMVGKNKRLVVFSDRGDRDGLPFTWQYCVENVYSNPSMDVKTCANSRAESMALNDKSRALFIQNYFPDFHPGFILPEAFLISVGGIVILNEALVAMAEVTLFSPLMGLFAVAGVTILAAFVAIAHEAYNEVNSSNVIIERVEACMKVSRRKPNFLAVDLYQMGWNGPSQVVKALNGEYFAGNAATAGGLARIYDITLDQVHANMQDADSIKLQIKLNACPPDRVELELQLGGDVNWWKGILLLKKDGWPTSDGGIDAQGDKKRQGLLSIDSVLLTTRSLVLSKAKFFGAHENKYWIKDAASAMQGGARYTFIWEKDN